MNISYNNEESNSASHTSPNRSSSDPAAPSPSSSLASSECQRIRELRITLEVSDDIPNSVLQAILEANDREALQCNSAITRSDNDLSRNGSLQRNLALESQRSKRQWDICQSAPSRPGILAINTQGAVQNIGHTDEAAIYTRRVESVHLVQENLYNRLGRTIDRSEYDAMRKEEVEGEHRLNKLEILRPDAMEWSFSQLDERMVQRAPFLPSLPDEPLALRRTSLNIDGEHELHMGIFVDDGSQFEEFKESSEWNKVTVDNSPMGIDEHLVRCCRCRAGLRVNVNTGLAMCPRCRNICPVTDLVDMSI